MIIENFRAFQGPIQVTFDNLTGLVGRNDVGKSSILEALDVFFEGGVCDLDGDDLCKGAETDEVGITCLFDDLPDSLVVDTATTTSLAEEQLLNAEGRLEIKKTWTCGKAKIGKPKVCARAVHAVLSDGASPLHLTRSKLRAACQAASVDLGGVNQNENPALRRALRTTLPHPVSEVDIELDKEDAKAVWAALQKHLPTFALFKSDRDSTDGDSEVQGPLKAAVRLAVGAAQDALDEVVSQVEQLTTRLATRTLEKLAEMSPELAAELVPDFEPPKWESLFKATFRTDNEIPLNKRGSGVRRLILLNFFRAEAERLAAEESRPLIYAIEEPETAQHPDNQRMLMSALHELAQTPNVQVIVTTHVPALAGLIPTTSLRLIERNGADRTVRMGDDGIYGSIAATLGVIADKRLELLVCVEGPTDVRYLKAISRLQRERHPELPDLSNDPRIAFVPLGGSTLLDWASQHHLRKLGAKEFHIYDRWPVRGNEPEYQRACDDVNGRGDGFCALLTSKNEMENYLHSDAIHAVCGVRIAVADDSRIDDDVAAAGTVRKRDVKHRLADAMERMTIGQLEERDPAGETLEWMRQINRLLR